jgi:hypothetical protein
LPASSGGGICYYRCGNYNLMYGDEMFKPHLLLALLAFSMLPASAQDKAVSRRPDGTGDPDGITCRPGQPLPQSRMMGPEVCKLNSEWALLRKKGQDISIDGKEIIPDPKGSNIAPMNCGVAGGGATSGGTMVCR